MCTATKEIMQVQPLKIKIMKKVTALILGLFAVVFSVNAASENSNTYLGTPFNGQSYIFVEGGVEFSVFPDGQFDFVFVGHNQGNNVNVNVAALLNPWWKITSAMLAHRFTDVWSGLQVLASITTTTTAAGTNNSPILPYATYATEIAQIYRRKLFQTLVLPTLMQQESLVKRF